MKLWQGRGRFGAPSAVVAAVVAVVVVVLAMALTLHGRGGSTPDAGPAGVTPTPSPSATAADPLAADIVKQQNAVRDAPKNYVAWANLGLDYVQQAKITVNPAYYPKATAVLARSLALNTTENYLAMAGQAALKAAEHDFAGARQWALRGLKINPYNATLYGSLNDANTQLGRYAEAVAAAQKMNDLQPGVAAFTRAEYVFELRGDLPHARQAMQEAAKTATAPADKAYAAYYLSELAFNAGDAATALRLADDGLRQDPSYAALLQAKARAEAGLGQTDAAVRDYTAVVNQVPQPFYVVEFGEYLESVGRISEARTQYSLFGTENALFQSNGVTLDTDPTLFYANHGQPALALKYGRVGIRIRPFIEMDDAYAWALHANHRDVEALAWERKAMALGTRNALFFYHAGMIEKSLGHPAAAKSYLQRALATNPHFNPLAVPVARRTLAGL